jgi:MFS family permease
LVFGALLLGWMTGLGWAIAGLVAVGLGLALGFPVMFGISSSLYSQTSGTAIGIVLAISLIGNLLANYIMGYMANSWGIGVFSFALIVAATVQAVVCNVLLRRVG